MGINPRRRRLEQLAVAVQGGSGGEEAARRRAAALATAGPGARAGSASQPYNNYSAEARGIGEQALVTARRSDLLPGVAPGPDGLTDEHVRCFCARGFLVIKPDKTPEFHRANVDEFDHNEGAYGGNMGGFGIHMDGLKAVYEDRHVQSALRSLLGPGCVMYQHNAMHRNGPGATNPRRAAASATRRSVRDRLDRTCCRAHNKRRSMTQAQRGRMGAIFANLAPGKSIALASRSAAPLPRIQRSIEGRRRMELSRARLAAAGRHLPGGDVPIGRADGVDRRLPPAGPRRFWPLLAGRQPRRAL